MTLRLFRLQSNTAAHVCTLSHTHDWHMTGTKGCIYQTYLNCLNGKHSFCNVSQARNCQASLDDPAIIYGLGLDV